MCEGLGRLKWGCSRDVKLNSVIFVFCCFLGFLMGGALFSRQSLVLQNGPPRALLRSSGGLQVHLFILVNFGGGTAGTMAIQVVQHSLRPSVDLVYFRKECCDCQNQFLARNLCVSRSGALFCPSFCAL